jgi:hypothetical protein
VRDVLAKANLQFTNDDAQRPGIEEPRSEGAGRIFSDLRQSPQSCAYFWRHVIKLPSDFAFYSLWPIRISKTDSIRRVGCGTKCVRAHMAYGSGLARGSSSCHCRGRSHFIRTHAPGKPTANLFSSLQLASRKSSGPGDESSRTAIVRSRSLKESKNSLCAVCSPCRDKTSISFT